MKKSEFILKNLAILLLGLLISCSSPENNDEDGNSSGSAGGKSSGSTAGGSSGSNGEGSSGSNSSSSTRHSSSSIVYKSSPSENQTGIETEGCPDFFLNGLKPGSDFIDSRNGQTYKTVIIGTQVWMAKNLNYDPGSGKSKCYGEGAGNGGDDWLSPDKPEDVLKIKENCDKYGRLYDWETAQNVCPDGWHLPSDDEWNTLKVFIEDEIFCNYEDEDYGWDVGTKLKAKTDWEASNRSIEGVNTYGFEAIGSGYCVLWEQLSTGAGFFAAEKREAHWWSATTYSPQSGGKTDDTKAYKYKVSYDTNVMTRKDESKTEYLYSVRCVKD